MVVEGLDGGPLRIEHDGDPSVAGARLTLEVVAAAVPVLTPRDSAARPAPALSAGGLA